jgi:hypothetical protein
LGALRAKPVGAFEGPPTPRALEEWLEQSLSKIQSRLPLLKEKLSSRPGVPKSSLPIEEPAAPEPDDAAAVLDQALEALPALGAPDGDLPLPAVSNGNEEEKPEPEGSQETAQPQEKEEERADGENGKKEEEKREEEKKQEEKREERRRKRPCSVFSVRFFNEFFKTVARYKEVPLFKYLCSKGEVEERVFFLACRSFGQPVYEDFYWRLTAQIKRLFTLEQAFTVREFFFYYAEHYRLTVEDYLEERVKADYTALDLLRGDLKDGVKKLSLLASSLLGLARKVETDAVVYLKERELALYEAWVFYAAGLVFGTPLKEAEEVYEKLEKIASVHPEVSPSAVFSRSFTAGGIMGVVERRMEEVFGVKKTSFSCATESSLKKASEVNLEAYGKLVRERKNHLTAFVEVQNGLDEEFKKELSLRLGSFLERPFQSYELVC